MEKRIVEIAGVKMEIDLRQAKTVESYKVGDNVKILYKTYSSWTVIPGVIVGFDNFEKLPTIIIAGLESAGYSPTIKFFYLNSTSTELEICPANEHELQLEKSDVISAFNKEITKLELQLNEIKQKKEWFLTHFDKYFKDVG